MTNQEILKIAMAQSAKDLCADASDFEKSENVVVLSRSSDEARRYLKLPFSCQLVSYGNNVVASVSPEFREIAENYINKYPVEHLFETPNLHVLNDALMEIGQKICFMAEYFLPDVNLLHPLDCAYELRVLTQDDFSELYLPEWSNALCEARRHLDVLGVGAYDNGSRKGIELIRFCKIDFSIYFAKFFLNMCIFLEEFHSPMKKSILSKLLRILRRINF